MDYIEHKMVEKVTAAGGPTENILLTPLNGILISVLAYTLYSTFFSRPAPVSLPPDPAPIVFRTFTPRTLLPFNGHPSDSNPNGAVFLAVRGKVFDVSPGRMFYGPGGTYQNFAGRDASRGLAKHSFEEDMLTKDLDGPLDPLGNLKDEEKEALRGWEERFNEKYIVVGRLVSREDLENMGDVKGVPA